MSILEAVLETPQITEEGVMDEYVRDMRLYSSFITSYVCMMESAGALTGHPELEEMVRSYKDVHHEYSKAFFAATIDSFIKKLK